MKLALLISAAPPQAEAASTAQRFCASAAALGHQVVTAFFFGDGVHNLARLARPGRDEADTVAAWQRLARDHGLRLVACSASAQRRGLHDADTARRLGVAEAGLVDEAELAGLGALVESLQCCDRVVSFP